MNESISALIRGRMAELGLHSADVGKLVYMQPASVRRKLCGRTFTLVELRQWCHALGITDAAKVGEAILQEHDSAKAKTNKRSR